MKCSLHLLGLVVTALVFLGSSVEAQAETQRLEVSSNGRFLVSDNGEPFFWLGDTNWRMHKLTRSEIRHYLDHRKSQKFNVIQGPVLLHDNTGGESTNAYGEANTDPSNPNEEWFEHIDYIVDQAERRGMYVALVVTWGDMWNYFNSNAEARRFGRYLGRRYRHDTNVIWIVAGEYLSNGTSQAIVNRFKYLALGLRDGGKRVGPDNLITVHGSWQEGRQSSSVKYHTASWLSFNMVHSSQSGNFGPGSENWKLVHTDRSKTPTKPVLDGEAHYENLGGWSAFGVRRRAYWSVFAGAFGHTYGANGVWSSFGALSEENETGAPHFWFEALDYSGARDMKHLRRLMESRPMLNRGPAQSILLSDPGDIPNHIRATRDTQGRYAMVYVPEPGHRIRINMNKISGSHAKAWWFNPRNGSASHIGNYPTSGARSFTTPSSGNDWVLVLDNKSKGYSRPGTGGPLQ